MDEEELCDSCGDLINPVDGSYMCNACSTVLCVGCLIGNYCAEHSWMNDDDDD